MSKRYAQAEVDEAIAQVDRGVFTPHAQIVLASEVAVLRSHEALTNNTGADLVVEADRLEAERDVARTQLQMATEAHELLERDLAGNLDEMARMQESIDLYRADLAESRRNCELFNDAHHAAELRIGELRATLERVETQLEKWRDRDNDWRQPHVGTCETEHGMDLAESRCIDELDAALKGTTP